ncbi:MAG: FIST C-terminal domain-containing protein [Bacteroidota bacterium]
MLLEYSDNTTIIQQIELLQPTEYEVVMLLFSEHDQPDITTLIALLNQKNIRFFGGVFPGLIYGNQRVSNGCILKKFKSVFAPFLIEGISESRLDGIKSLGTNNLSKGGTAIILLDGLTNNIHLFLEMLNDLIGEHCNFIGAGAGSSNLKQQPCVFNHEGIKMDAAVVCLVEQKVHLGVRHGWEQLAGPLVATHTNGNTILQLNWQPAMLRYNQIIENDCGISLNNDNFASIAKAYPFGILREKEDDIVRDPLAIGENGSIICIGEVPTNTVLYVLKGQPHALLQAAETAIRECGEGDKLPIECAGVFIVDCATRAEFLGNQFQEELNIIRNNLIINTNEQEPYGVLSLGEISSYGEGLLEFFNKTIVIGAFY